LSGLKASLNLNQKKSPVELVPIENDNESHLLPSKQEFTVEIQIGDFRDAELILTMDSHPQSNNPIRLIQSTAPAGSEIEYQILKRAIKDENTRITALFISKDPSDPLINAKGLNVAPKKDEEGLWGSVKLPNHTDKTFLLITNKDGRYFIRDDEVNVPSKLLGIVIGLGVVIVFLIIVWLFARTWKDFKWNQGWLAPFNLAVTPL